VVHHVFHHVLFEFGGGFEQLVTSLTKTAEVAWYLQRVQLDMIVETVQVFHFLTAMMALVHRILIPVMEHVFF
jgi:hypothetical protein